MQGSQDRCCEESDPRKYSNHDARTHRTTSMSQTYYQPMPIRSQRNPSRKPEQTC